MGEAKRRKDSIGDEFGKEERIVSWLPITKTQSEDFVRWTSRGSWIGISLLVGWWIVVRFVGPAAGWWVVD
ncbi:DUF2839 domain-containing protein [Tychonema sp. LEGE 07199]|uniref:DUF2839 domain-containing protein n=1 Tax=Microcoleaceae TaxID=1892252 RepID=UPI00187F491B|nr:MULTISPECIES: DUF2839 domain-containing protein [unclassified Tychonema]MBE9122421.1 DUF2839 domain-containing protein [Tychonema sp. LEGE 07199]MBE9134814.1 DUF2839 domain-containing protein [Tychonema sp. LEGE 07196]